MSPVHDYSQYNLNQLYDVLRNGDLDGFPERLAAVERQIELKGGDITFSEEGEGESPEEYENVQHISPSTAGGVSDFLIVTAISTFCVYGFPCWIVFRFFLSGSSYDRPGELQQSVVMALMACLILLMIPAMGVASMRQSLFTLSEKVAVKAWALLAATLAPFSAIAYGILIGYVLKLSNSTGHQLNIGDIAPYLIFCTLGFYMPFVLLTFWLKYKYRQDEF